MSGKQHRGHAAQRLPDQIPNQRGAVGVQRGEWFVEQNQVGVGNQRAGNRQALFHAA